LSLQGLADQRLRCAIRLDGDAMQNPWLIALGFEQTANSGNGGFGHRRVLSRIFLMRLRKASGFRVRVSRAAVFCFGLILPE